MKIYTIKKRSWIEIQKRRIYGGIWKEEREHIVNYNHKNKSGKQKQTKTTELKL